MAERGWSGRGLPAAWGASLEALVVHYGVEVAWSLGSRRAGAWCGDTDAELRQRAIENVLGIRGAPWTVPVVWAGAGRGEAGDGAGAGRAGA